MSELAGSLIYLLKRTELAVRGCVELALSPFDLTPSQFFILVLVESQEATSSAELARAMGVLPQSMSDLIAPLEKRGAILRNPDPQNRRILRIALTRDGRQLYERAAEAGQHIEQQLLRSVSASELARLKSLLSGLMATAEAHESHPAVRRRLGAAR